MATINDITPTAENVVALIGRLSPEEQRILNEKLGFTAPSENEHCENSIDDVYGAWDFDESPEETVRKIREDRQFNRTRESQ